MREKITNELMSCGGSNILLELPTGLGKTKLALDYIFKYNFKNILIIVPTKNLIKNWINEFNKFNLSHLINRCDIICYNSIHKYNKKLYNCIIFDEAHHITELVLIKLKNIKYEKSLMLTATISKEKREIIHRFNDLYIIKATLKEAINNNILPKPVFKFIPMELDNTNKKYIIRVAGKQGKATTVNYEDRFKFLKYNKNKKFILYLRCTAYEYYLELNNKINFYKNKNRYRTVLMRTLLLRLKFLSDLKTNYLIKLQKKLKNERTLVFCNSIKQAEYINKNNISSKNKKSESILNDFNNHKINHITAVNMLNEGMNLSDLRIAIFGVINASEIMYIQKIGRVLRHPNPIVYVPYFKNTREEVLIKKIQENDVK